MRKFVLMIAVALLIIGGCSPDKDKKGETSNEATIRGVIQEVNSDTILMLSKDRIHSGQVQVSKRVEKNEKVLKDLNVGDEILVYYDGYISESDPAQINGVEKIEISKKAELSEDGEVVIEEDDYYSMPRLTVIVGSESRELTERQSALVHDLINNIEWDRGVKDDSEDDYTVIDNMEVLFTFNSKTNVLNDRKNDISVKLEDPLSILLKEVLDDEF